MLYPLSYERVEAERSLPIRNVARIGPVEPVKSRNPSNFNNAKGTIRARIM